MDQSQLNDDAKKALEEAEEALSRLPILGSVVWLMARSPERRFTFLADLEWAALPPILLDQCRIFLQGKMPFAYVTWAFVSDEVQERLIGGTTKLAPHEWKSGDNLWLIDIIAPFGSASEIVDEVHRINFPAKRVLRFVEFDPVLRRGVVRERERAVEGVSRGASSVTLN